MIPYLTSTVPNPWTKYDINNYINYGSQRDNVHYNSYYNSRIILQEENLFQCSVKNSSDGYKNVYLFAVRRNLFYFICYVPQMEIFNKKEVLSNELIQKIVGNLPLCQKFISAHNDNGINLFDNTIDFTQSACFMVKVNANVNEFLFPHTNFISNSEIISKYRLMNKVYLRIIQEYSVLCNAYEKYYQKLNEHQKRVQEQIEEFQNKIKRKLIRKGICVAVSAIGIPAFLFDALDDIATLDDISDIVDFADMADAVDFDFDSIDMDDLSDNYLTSNYEVSFGSRRFDEAMNGLDDLYDPHIESAYDKYADDLNRIREKGPYSWEKPETTFDRDRYSIDYWKRAKEEAIGQARIDEAFQQKIDAINDYCKESMNRKIDGWGTWNT